MIKFKFYIFDFTSIKMATATAIQFMQHIDLRADLPPGFIKCTNDGVLYIFYRTL